MTALARAEGRAGRLVLVDGLVGGFGEVEAFAGVSFEARGEVFGLLGPNGAGKTTTIRVLTTLLRPSCAPASACRRSRTSSPRRGGRLEKGGSFRDVRASPQTFGPVRLTR